MIMLDSFLKINLHFHNNCQSYLGQILMSWTQQEQEMLKALKQSSQGLNWSAIAKKIGETFENKLRTPKQCRQRYINYVQYERKDEKFTTWTQDEENLLYELYEKRGSNWNVISESFDYKSENTIKNKFYGSLRKLLRRLNIIGKSHKKLKKCLRYQSIIRPLQIAKYVHKCPDLIQLANQLRASILSFLRTKFENLDNQRALKFIQTINRFNLMSRSMSKKKKKVVIGGSDKSGIEEEDSIQQEAPIKLEESDKAENVKVQNANIQNQPINQNHLQRQTYVNGQQNIIVPPVPNYQMFHQMMFYHQNMLNMMGPTSYSFQAYFPQPTGPPRQNHPSTMPLVRNHSFDPIKQQQQP